MGINRLTGGPRGSGVCPLPRASLGHRLAWIFLPQNHIYSKKISVSFYPVWTPFDMYLLRNKKHATNRNWHWALDQYVSPKNNLKICQKYMKVVEYWHGTIKNYRYDGDVSSGSKEGITFEKSEEVVGEVENRYSRRVLRRKTGAGRG